MKHLTLALIGTGVLAGGLMAQTGSTDPSPAPPSAVNHPGDNQYSNGRNDDHGFNMGWLGLVGLAGLLGLRRPHSADRDVRNIDNTGPSSVR